MNEPSDQAREVLARYRDAISPSSAERAALVLGVRRAIATGAGPSAAASAAAVGRRTPWLVIVGVTAVVAGGAWWSTRSPELRAPAIAAAVEAPAAAPEVKPPPVAAQAPAMLPSVGPAVAEAPAMATATPQAERIVGRRSPRIAVPSEASPAADVAPSPASAPSPEVATVDAEVALLREASVALKRGDDVTARTRYDEHTRRFPDGALVELREVGLALLDCRRDPSAAADRARRFATRFPGSPHLVRIERECTP